MSRKQSAHPNHIVGGRNGCRFSQASKEKVYFPVSIYMGKTVGAELARGLLIQAGWVIAAYLMARFAWKRGIKHYSAVGG